jgi:hypothetical protein
VQGQKSRKRAGYRKDSPLFFVREKEKKDLMLAINKVMIDIINSNNYN